MCISFVVQVVTYQWFKVQTLYVQHSFHRLTSKKHQHNIQVWRTTHVETFSHNPHYSRP